MMEKVIFKKSEAMELVSAIVRLAYDGKRKDIIGENHFLVDDSIVQWVKAAKTGMSSYMQREMESLIKSCPFNMYFLYMLVNENSLDDGSSLIKLLKSIPVRQYLDYMYIEYDTPKQAGKDALLENIKSAYEPEEQAVFIEMLEHPEETLERLHLFVTRFYETQFRELADSTMKILDAKMNEHEKLLSTLGNQFIKTITLLDDRSIEQCHSMTFYVSHFSEVSLVITNTLASEHSPTKDYIIIYGHHRARKLDDAINSMKVKAFYKVLSDDKRLEILKLILKRSWYGNELAKHLSITTATLSYHMDKLSTLGIISFEAGENNRIYYRASQHKVQELFGMMLEELIK